MFNERIDLTATLDGGQAFRWFPENGDGYRGVIDGIPVRIWTTPTGTRIEGVARALRDEEVATCRKYLGLATSDCPDVEYGEFVRAFQSDHRLGPALGRWPDLRILRQAPWECLVAFLASATSNIPRIKRNVNAMAVSLGTCVGPGPCDFAFPTPERIQEAGEERLRQLGLGFRARYILRAAEVVGRGRFDLEGLRSFLYPEAREALMTLDGVGEKIADCVLAFSLEKREAFPVDRWVRRALETWYQLPRELSNSQAAEWARERFGSHGAYAQQYLFHRQRRLGRSSDRPSLTAPPIVPTASGAVAGPA